MIKPFISPGRPKGLALRTRLGKIVARMDRVRVVYQLPAPDKRTEDLTGFGNLHVEIRNERLQCRVLGEVFRPNDYEYAFHSFWLTRRGMVLIIFGLAGELRTFEAFIQPTGIPASKLKAEAIKLLRLFRRDNGPAHD